MRRSAVLTAVAFLVVAGSAALASGTVSVGSVLSGDPSPRPSEYRKAEETVLALGTDPQVGRWRITAYTSPELADAGEVVQPAGLPCLKLLLSNADGTPVAGRSYCGARGKDGLTAAALPVRDPSGRVLNVLLGEAPGPAAAVELTADGRSPQQAPLHDGPPGFGGHVWMLVAPGDPPIHAAALDWMGADGVGSGNSIDLTLQLSRPAGPVPLGAPAQER